MSQRKRLEWTSNHQCTSSGWGRSSRFEDEPKTHPLPVPRDFSALFFAPKFSKLPTPPPPYYFPHLISHSLHLQSSGELPSLNSIKLQGDVDTRLEEGGELNIEGMWRGERKRSASSQMQKRKRKGKFFPFSTFLFFSMVFFLCVFFFFSYVWEEKDAKRKHLKRKGRSRRAKVRAKNERAEWELEGKIPLFFLPFVFTMVFFFFVFFFFFFFFLCFFFFFSSIWKEENVKKKCLKRKGRNKRAKARAKNERAEHEFEGKFPPFFAFFFSLCFFSFLLLEKKKMLRESIWNGNAKEERQNQEPKVRGQNGSLKVSSFPSLPFFSFLWFLFLCVFSFFFYLRRRRCKNKTLETKVQK